ncbi:MAG: DNA polymerase III subunit delta [Myxococcota bacterium]
MTPAELAKEVKNGGLRPVYLVCGPETYLAQQVVSTLRAAVELGPGAAFNEDKFVAGDASADTVVSAAQTAPMMAPKRWVLVRNVERWDGGEALDIIHRYAAEPSPSTVLVLVASKIHGQRRLMKRAKKDGFLVSCDELKARQLPAWIKQRAKAKGHGLGPGLAEALSDLLGPELAPVDDALERLSLFVGEGATIDEAAVSEVVMRLRQDTVWALVDALADRDAETALHALTDAYDPRDRGLPVLGAVAWKLRQIVKFHAGLRAGQAPKTAASAAKMRPFGADALAAKLRRVPASTVEHWLMCLAEADLALKGSKRDGLSVLTTVVVDMCGASRPGRRARRS